MYRLLIVDDEKIIREGIKNSVDWKSYDITTVKTAANGEEAIELLGEMNPHIILCDIMMDAISGFDVLEKVNNKNQSSKVIFLTGHDDFKFAQQAIRLGAFDYLLKISNVEEITQVIEKAILEIQKESEHQKSYENLKQKVEEYSPLLKNKYMNMIVEGKEIVFRSSEGKDNPYTNLKNTLEISYFMLVAFRSSAIYNNVHKGKQNELALKIQKHITEWCNEEFNENLMSFQNMAGDYIIIKAFPDTYDRDLIENIFIKKCSELQLSIKKEFNIMMFVGVSKTHKVYTNIKRGYNEAIESFDYYSLEAANIVNFLDVMHYQKVNPSISIADEKLLMGSFKSYNSEKMDEILTKIFKQFEEYRIVERREILDFSLILYGMIRKVLLELKIDVTSIFSNESFYNRILSANDYKDLKQCVYQLFFNTSKIVSSTNVRVVTDNIQYACEYIESHFSEDITLEKIANMIHLSPNHFSNLFSKQTGMSFLQYLTSCRIEKAKMLLMDKNYKNYEVGECVGYLNPHYFSRIFKKHTGMPPTKYRENMLKTYKII